MNKLDAEAISNLFREHLETQSSSLWDFVQKIVKHHHCTGCNCSPDADTPNRGLDSNIKRALMSSLVTSIRNNMGSLESNDLGTREFTLTKKSGVNTNVALQNFMTQYLSDSPHFSDESNAKEEAFRRYKRVISLTNDYFKSNIFLGENFPAKWSDIASCKQHEYILERVLFYSDRDISPRLPLTCDQYDEIHNHLIPIHLMQNKNGARLLLTDALARIKNANKKAKISEAQAQGSNSTNGSNSNTVSNADTANNNSATNINEWDNPLNPAVVTPVSSTNAIAGIDLTSDDGMDTFDSGLESLFSSFNSQPLDLIGLNTTGLSNQTASKRPSSETNTETDSNKRLAL